MSRDVSPIPSLSWGQDPGEKNPTFILDGKMHAGCFAMQPQPIHGASGCWKGWAG